MKNQIDFTMKFATILLTLLVLFSCNQEKKALLENEDQPQVSSTPKTSSPQPDYKEPISTNNAVKIGLNSSSAIDWEAFKSTFHKPVDLIDSKENMAIGPWIKRGEYDYQWVYTLENNNLWLQSYVKKESSSDALDSNVTPHLLTLQNADQFGLGSLWNEMVERGLFLTDSLTN
ncbi:hypothetical protein [Algoriphagus litoralis]|uniref:hypothetical protein n=1 Tax=Algoriphagus litoralis TaxID=2202829 RepID=UPI000DB9ED91|nr:hypothetical protein [Algoriphagus litoralis]